MIRFAQDLKVLPILAPAATTTVRQSSYIDCRNHQWASFLIPMGAMTSDSTDIATITVECSPQGSSHASEVQVPFKYRLSAAVDTDNMGAIATATAAAGATITAEDDNKVLLIDVDLQQIPRLLATGRFLRVVIDGTGLITSYSMGVIAAMENRYPGNAMTSST